MSTDCPWLIVQGDCNLHKSWWLAASNEVNPIAKKSVKLVLFQNLLHYFYTLKIFFLIVQIYIGPILVDSKRNTHYNYTYNSFNIENISKWLFYPSQVSNELLFVWFTDFLHIERFKSVTYEVSRQLTRLWNRAIKFIRHSASQSSHTYRTRKYDFFFLKVSHRYLWYIQKLWQRWSNMWAALSAKAHRDNF